MNNERTNVFRPTAPGADVPVCHDPCWARLAPDDRAAHSRALARMKKLLSFILGTLLLSGCAFKMPSFDSGLVEFHMVRPGANMPRQHKLSPSQVRSLLDWFSQHKAGWKSDLSDLAPDIWIRLSRDGKEVIVVNVLPTIVHAGDSSLPISQSDRDQLLRLIGANEG